MIIEYDIHCFERTLQIKFPEGYEHLKDEVLKMLDDYYLYWHDAENIADPDEKFAVQDSCLEEYMMDRLSETYNMWEEWDSIPYEEEDNMSKYEMLARDIYKWCKKKDLWGDNTIYFDGKAWSHSKEWGGVRGTQIDEDLYEYADKNPKDYFEYANPKTLSMSFEGPLNHVLNCYTPGWVELEEEFLALFEKYGCYYEMGYSWSLSVYEN